MTTATSEDTRSLVAAHRAGCAASPPLALAIADIDRVRVLIDGVVMLSPGDSSGRVLTKASELLTGPIPLALHEASGTGLHGSSSFLDELYEACALVQAATALARQEECPEFCALAEVVRDRLDALGSEFDAGGTHHHIFLERSAEGQR